MRPDIWRFLLLALVCFGAGLALGRPYAGLLAGTLVAGAWYYRTLLRLLRYLHHGREQDLPDLPGVVNELIREFEALRSFYRQREEKLSSFLTRFQDAAAALPDAIVILNRDGEIEWANGKAGDYLNVSWPQDAHRRIVNLVRHPELVALLEAGDYSKAVEIPSPDGTERRLTIMIVPYGRDQMLLVARDVTSIVRLNQIRSDFVANVSHELRTPLTVVTGYLENLDQEENCPDQLKPVIQKIQVQALRIHEIIKDLLLLSRLEQEQDVPDPKEVAVPEMLNRIYQEAQILSGDRGHIFYLEVALELRIRGNEQELYSAFSNLVFNAVRYTPARGVIRMRWYADAAGAHLEVRDTGVGIPPEHLPRLTERFYRVDKSRSREKGGTGLGLAIVKHVLSRHRARLHIESKVGEGSLFRCDFPAETLSEQHPEERRGRSA
jgi:two-component system phosphate regulon sensor histidine kinase PhoR